MIIEFLDELFEDKKQFPWELDFEEFLGNFNIDDGYAIDGRRDFEYDWIWEIADNPTELSYILSESFDGNYVKKVMSQNEEKPTYILYNIDDEAFGFYTGVECWIDFEYRGKDLSTLLIATSAIDQEGSPNKEQIQGFSPSGYRAHEKAYFFLIEYAKENHLFKSYSLAM
jgi:hypothetical protein